jgi:hypothetical protein
MCQHQPPCPNSDSTDRDSAHIVAFFPVQGWCLRCNGVISFDDTGDLLPDGRLIAPRELPAPHVPASEFAGACQRSPGNPSE